MIKICWKLSCILLVLSFNFRDEFLAEHALDGDPSTFFATGYDESWHHDTTEWLMIDFGDRYPIVQINPIGHSANLDYLGNFKVKQCSKCHLGF